MLNDISLPITDKLSQHATMRRGHSIYQDTAGINIIDAHYFTDNGDVRHRKGQRKIQQGRYYRFTGFEHVNTNLNCRDYSGTIKIKFAAIGNTYYERLIGSTSGGIGSDFVIRILNTQGLQMYTPNGIFTLSSTNEYTDGSIHELELDFSNGIRVIIDDSVELYNDNTPFGFWGNMKTWHISSPTNQPWNGIVYSASFTQSFYETAATYYFDESLGIVAYNAANSANHGDINLGGVAESSFHKTGNEVLSSQNELGHWYSGDAYGVGALTPIDLSGDGTKDVLGNSVPLNYRGNVRYDIQIKGSSILLADGFIDLSHPDLTGVTIVTSIGSSTPTISGNNILLTTGDLYYLELSNGEKYDFRERKGDITYEQNEGNALTINRYGAGVDIHWGASDTQTPHDLINGYWVADPDLGVRYPYNVGGDKTYILGNGKVFNASGNTIDRNFADAPQLHINGISIGEDLSYSDLISDKSRFYENIESNLIASLLSYDDFSEPISGSAGNFDGLINLSHPNLTGITISSWEGTATPTISGNDILVTLGVLTELILSDGSKYVFSEESGLTLYDLIKQNDLTINLNGAASGSQWLAGGNKNYHHNLQYGYYDLSGVKVPGDITNPGFDVMGNPISNTSEVNKYKTIINYLKK